MGRSVTGLSKRDKLVGTRIEMGNLGPWKPYLLFVFNKNELKPRFLGMEKDCTSQDSNSGPQHWNSENHPVGFL